MGTNLFNNDTTASNNTSFASIGIAGTNNVSNFDNALRAFMASLKSHMLDIGGANTVGGSANAITITPASSTIDALYDGLRIGGRVAYDNSTTTPTLNAGSSGAKVIKKSVLGVETALAAGDLQVGEYGHWVYRSAWDSASGAWEWCPQEFGNTDYAASSHSHVIGDTTGLQTALDAKSDVGHAHAAGDVTSGTFADALIAESNVTQHEAALTIGAGQVDDGGKQTVFIPAGSFVPRTTNGAAFSSYDDGDHPVECYAFDASTAEYVHVPIGMPLSQDDTDDISVMLVWSHDTTTTNFGVSWAVSGVSIGNDDAGSNAAGTEVNADDTGGTTDDWYYTGWITVTISDLTSGEITLLEVMRDVADAADTMAIDARLIGVFVRYENDRINDDDH